MLGAPGEFPVAERNRRLQKYLQWSNEIEKKARDFIESELPEGPFVGIHLRTGSDWVNDKLQYSLFNRRMYKLSF